MLVAQALRRQVLQNASERNIYEHSLDSGFHGLDNGKTPLDPLFKRKQAEDWSK